MWMPKLDWMPDGGHEGVKSVQMLFTENTTEDVAEVFIVWVADEASERRLYTQRWECVRSTGLWSPVPGPLRETVEVCTIEGDQIIFSVERSVSGDFLIQLGSEGSPE